MKVKNTKKLNVSSLSHFRFFTVGVFNVLALFMLWGSVMLSLSAVVSASTITASMSAEVAAEFNKQLNKQVFPKMSNRLSMMKNPYRKLLKDINKKIGDKADDGYDSNYHRRLMTHDESVIKAESRRFRSCQRTIVSFVGFSRHAKAFSSELTKYKIMSGNTFGVDYPFSQEQSSDANIRPSQIALDLGWKYQGQGEEHVDVFFNNCLALPINMYYVEDKF